MTAGSHIALWLGDTFDLPLANALVCVCQSRGEPPKLQPRLSKKRSMSMSTKGNFFLSSVQRYAGIVSRSPTGRRLTPGPVRGQRTDTEQRQGTESRVPILAY